MKFVQQRFKIIFLKRREEFESQESCLRTLNVVRKNGISSTNNYNPEIKILSNKHKKFSEESETNLLKNCDKNFMVITSFV